MAKKEIKKDLKKSKGKSKKLETSLKDLKGISAAGDKGLATRFKAIRTSVRKKLHTLAGRIKNLLQKLKDLKHVGKIVMYDSVTVSEIPRDAKAAAGYVNGIYHTWPDIQNGPWPNKLSIAVTASADAKCLDCEPGDATAAQAPAWVKKQKSKGVNKPVVYTSVGNAAALLGALSSAGIGRGDIKLWTAHYTYKKHICSPSCGYGLTTSADATQWTDHSGGHNLDESLCNGDFFNA